MPTPNSPPPDTFTLVDVLARLTSIVSPIAGGLSVLGHGPLTVGLGVLCGVLTGQAGNFAIRRMNSRLEALCPCREEIVASEEPGCAAQIALLGLEVLIAATPILSTQLAGQLALSLYGP